MSAKPVQPRLEWSHDSFANAIKGHLHGWPELTLFVIFISIDDEKEGRLWGAFIPDPVEGTLEVSDVQIEVLKQLAENYYAAFMLRAAKAWNDAGKESANHE